MQANKTIDIEEMEVIFWLALMEMRAYHALLKNALDAPSKETRAFFFGPWYPSRLVTSLLIRYYILWSGILSTAIQIQTFTSLFPGLQISLYQTSAR
jgi:hypothetical protein